MARRILWTAAGHWIDACLCAGWLSAPPVAALTIYVNQNALGPTHDGASWATAFREVQEGLAAA